MNRNPVTASLADPYQLELLYRENPEQFVRFFRQAIEAHPRAQILQFWQARLRHRPEPGTWSSAGLLRYLRLLLVLCGGAFLLIKLPEFLPVDWSWYLPRFAPFVVFLSLALFIARVEALSKRSLAIPATGFGLLALVLGLLPHDLTADSIIMALIHAPIVAWCLLGYTFTATAWRDTWLRMDFVRANGEVFILTTLILLGGMVLTGLTQGLFQLIGVEIIEWYMGNIAVLGAVSAPLVATFLYHAVLNRQSRFAPLIANVFIPLFLVTIVAYLIAMVGAQKSPYSDREFLIIFNGLLLLVLAMTVFSIVGRDPDRPSRLTDTVIKALLGVTLLVDVVALSAMGYRLMEFGLTPNRLVVIGVNLLVFAHLLLIIAAFSRITHRLGWRLGLDQAVVGFLPVYGVWAVSILVLLPPLFAYQ